MWFTGDGWEEEVALCGLRETGGKKKQHCVVYGRRVGRSSIVWFTGDGWEEEVALCGLQETGGKKM